MLIIVLKMYIKYALCLQIIKTYKNIIIIII